MCDSTSLSFQSIVVWQGKETNNREKQGQQQLRTMNELTLKAFTLPFSLFVTEKENQKDPPVQHSE